MKLIDKDKVVAEIEKKLQDLVACVENTSFIEHKVVLMTKIDMCKEILSFLGTLEAKEVELEEHLKEDIENIFFDLGVAVNGATYYLTIGDIKEIAKHFFELGLKAKGE